jgi:hypothetical protein
MKKTNKFTLFIDHTYILVFRSPSETILRVYSIKEYNKMCVCVCVCVANLPKTWIYKML